MKDGVVYICCNRPGCNKTLGAQRYEDNKVVEEEFYPFVVKDEDGYFYCDECISKKDVFKDVMEDADVSSN